MRGAGQPPGDRQSGAPWSRAREAGRGPRGRALARSEGQRWSLTAGPERGSAPPAATLLSKAERKTPFGRRSSRFARPHAWLPFAGTRHFRRRNRVLSAAEVKAARPPSAKTKAEATCLPTVCGRGASAPYSVLQTRQTAAGEAARRWTGTRHRRAHTTRCRPALTRATAQSRPDRAVPRATTQAQTPRSRDFIQ